MKPRSPVSRRRFIRQTGTFLSAALSAPAVIPASALGRSGALSPSVAKQLKRTLKWDPQAEQFIGDDEANRLLSIAKRPPWCV